MYFITNHHIWLSARDIHNKFLGIWCKNVGNSQKVVPVGFLEQKTRNNFLRN